MRIAEHDSSYNDSLRLTLQQLPLVRRDGTNPTLLADRDVYIDADGNHSRATLERSRESIVERPSEKYSISCVGDARSEEVDY